LSIQREQDRSSVGYQCDGWLRLRRRPTDVDAGGDPDCGRDCHGYSRSDIHDHDFADGRANHDRVSVGAAVLIGS